MSGSGADSLYQPGITTGSLLTAEFYNPRFLTRDTALSYLYLVPLSRSLRRSYRPSPIPDLYRNQIGNRK